MRQWLSFSDAAPLETKIGIPATSKITDKNIPMDDDGNKDTKDNKDKSVQLKRKQSEWEEGASGYGRGIKHQCFKNFYISALRQDCP